MERENKKYPNQYKLLKMKLDVDLKKMQNQY